MLVWLMGLDESVEELKSRLSEIVCREDPRGSDDLNWTHAEKLIVKYCEDNNLSKRELLSNGIPVAASYIADYHFEAV